MKTDRCLTINDLASNFRGMPRDAPLVIKIGDRRFYLCGTSAEYLLDIPTDMVGATGKSVQGVYSIILLAGDEVGSSAR